MENIEAHVVLGYTCNSHCKHCVVQVKRNKYETTNSEQLNLTVDEAREHIINILSKNVDEIVISGGEPTLRSDIVELITMILDKNTKVQIQTNGINTEVIRKIVEMNKDKKHLLTFMIPLHANNPKEHDFVTGHRGGFNKTIMSLEYLSNNGIAMIGKVVLTKLTGDLENIICGYEKYGVKDIIITYPHCVSFPNEQVKSIDLKLDEVERKLLFINKLDKDINIILQGMTYCCVNQMYHKIQESDTEYLKRRIIEYKYRDEFEYLWHEFRVKDKRKFSKCKSCEFNKKCEGIWKEYIRVYGDE